MDRVFAHRKMRTAMFCLRGHRHAEGETASEEVEFNRGVAILKLSEDVAFVSD